MDDILVKFEAQAEGLKPGIDQLVQLEVVDKNVAEQAKKTAQAIRDRDKGIADGAKASKANIDQLANSLKGLDKSIAGGTMRKTLSEITTELKLTKDEAVKFYKLLQSNAKTEILGAKSQEDLAQLNSILEESQALLDQMGGGLDDTGEKAVSMKAKLRELKNQMQQMEEAGQSDTKAFHDMQIAAGKLEDQIGDTNERIRVLASDTFVFDALVGGAQGVTAAFSIAQGATALFGSENEDLQKALLKVQGAMALLQGIQQVQLLMQKQSVVYLGVENALRRLGALNTTLQAGAESQYVVVRYGAIAAQKVLNTVMAANPAGVLLVALGALAAVLVYFTSRTNEAADAQKKLNNQLDFQLGLADQYVDAIKRAGDKQAQELTNNNATAKEIRTADLKNLEAQANEYRRIEDDKAATAEQASNILREAAAGRIKLTNDEIKAYQDTQSKFSAIQNKRFAAEHATDVARLKDEGETRKESLADHTAYVNAKLARTVQGSRDELVATIASIRAQEAESVATGGKTAAQVAQIRAEADRKVAEVHNQIRNYDLQQDLFVAEAKANVAKKGSVEELQAKKDQAAAETAIELNKLGISAKEKAAINARSAAEQKDFDNQIAIRTVEIAGAANSAKLALAKQGSKEEFDLKIESLKNERDIALVNAGDIAEKQAQVEAEYQRKRLDLSKEYNRRIAEETVSGRVASLNEQIAQLQVDNASATNEKLLQTKKDLMDEQAALEVISIQYTETNEELRRAKIKAVYAKALADKTQLERDKSNAEIQFAVDMSNGVLQQEIAKNNHIASSEMNSLSTRWQAQLRIFDLKRQMLDNEAAAEDQRFADGIISWEDYQRKLLEISGKYQQLDYDQTAANENKKKQLRDQLTDAGAQFTLMVGNALFDAQKQRLDDEAKADEDLKGKKILSEEGYQRRQRDINIRKAKADKEAALFNIGITTAQNIVKAFPNVIEMAIAGALGITQAAIVAAKSLPKYRHGKVRIDGPGTDTSDSILARISREESVINAAMTRKWEPALRAINEDKFEGYLASIAAPPVPYDYLMPPAPEWAKQPVSTMDIDYDRLGQAVADHVGTMKDMPAHTIKIDQDGIMLIVTEGLTQTQFLNNRYSS